MATTPETGTSVHKNVDTAYVHHSELQKYLCRVKLASSQKSISAFHLCVFKGLDKQLGCMSASEAVSQLDNDNMIKQSKQHKSTSALTSPLKQKEVLEA